MASCVPPSSCQKAERSTGDPLPFAAARPLFHGFMEAQCKQQRYQWVSLPDTSSAGILFGTKKKEAVVKVAGVTVKGDATSLLQETGPVDLT